MWFLRDLKKKKLIEDLRKLREIRYDMRELSHSLKEEQIREWRKKVGINNSQGAREFILMDHINRVKLLREARQFINMIQVEMMKNEEILKILESDNDYEILGLDEKASIIELKKSFRMLAKKYHPDTGGDSELFITVNNAYKGILKRLGNEN